MKASVMVNLEHYMKVKGIQENSSFIIFTMYLDLPGFFNVQKMYTCLLRFKSLLKT